MSVPKRHQIREAVKEMLLGQTLAGENVYSNRVSSFWREELPCISAFFRDEEATPRDISGKNYTRKATIAIEIHAEASEDLDLKLDEISEQVEAIIIGDLTLKGTVFGCVYQGADFDFSGDAQKPIGVISLSYQITFK